MKTTGPRILLLDFETLPLEVYAFGLYDQNIGVSQIKKHGSILSYSAKWYGKRRIYYGDTRSQKDIRNDYSLLKEVSFLLARADIVITQNGKSFDSRYFNYRCAVNGLPPVQGYRHIDTKLLAKKHFFLPSYSLEYMAKVFGLPAKLTNRRFAGFNLWKGCLEGEKAAWSEMRRYNKHDVVVLEALYDKIKNFGTGINLAPYNNGQMICSCGSSDVVKWGYRYTHAGKYQAYKCKSCGSRMQELPLGKKVTS